MDGSPVGVYAPGSPVGVYAPGSPVGVYAPGSPVHGDVLRLTDEVARVLGLNSTVTA